LIFRAKLAVFVSLAGQYARFLRHICLTVLFI